MPQMHRWWRRKERREAHDLSLKEKDIPVGLLATYSSKSVNLIRTESSFFCKDVCRQVYTLRFIAWLKY